MDLGDTVKYKHNDKIHGISVSGILYAIDTDRVYIISDKAIEGTAIIKDDIVKSLRHEGKLTVIKPVEKDIESISLSQEEIKIEVENRLDTSNLICNRTHKQIAQMQGINRLK